ncbi:L-fucose isomerase [Boudabousia marimammalium]|uniref:L-fucose isomerase n=1 Tax=Boudabousia marimammalium TaxID=156892 RepID=A0A1Q5PS76_9ACTO|nr:L-fucose isomerase [Boudabousia marimammalium]OKL50438.1 L-fucose isomerase [Boudabousia marimammalium]
MTINPKIVIRPIIDGREAGVRESLEEKTLKMARTAADLIKQELRYFDGTPVECIVPDFTIGRAGDAAKMEELTVGQKVCAELTVTPCWDYVTEVLDMDPRIQHAVWGFNGTERPGAVTLAAAMAAYAQFGVSAFGIYGRDVQDLDDDSVPEDVKEKLLRFARAAIAIGQFAGSNYLQIGSQCMGIAGSMIDRDFFKSYLGLGVESVDMTEIAHRVEGGVFDEEEYQEALAWFKDKVTVGDDIVNGGETLSQEEYDEQFEYSVKMCLVVRDLMKGNPKLAEAGLREQARGHNAIVGGFQGQRQWTDWKPNADMVESIMNTSFDWTGNRPPITFATENDTLNGATMLLSQYLTNRAQLFSDVRTFWSPESVERVTGHKLEGHGANGFLDLRNSGASSFDASGAMLDEEGNPTVKPWWEVTEGDIEATLDHVRLYPANRNYFLGGGFSTQFITANAMPMTMARINICKGLGPVLQLAEGWAVTFDEEAMKKIIDRTDPAWPTTFFAPRLNGKGAFTSVYSVMDHWGANHGAIGFGHYGADLISMAAMLRIPVSMHNVEGELFRPRNWDLFGTDNLESADYAACRTYGPFFG